VTGAAGVGNNAIRNCNKGGEEVVVELVAEIDSDDVRLCSLRTRAFDGYVKAGPSEAEECEDGTILFKERKRRVLSERTIKDVGALRVEASRACAGAGIKTPLGVLVLAVGLAYLVSKERSLGLRAQQIYLEMLEQLERAGEDTSLAKCEVNLISVRLTPDAEFRDSMAEVVKEAVTVRLDEASALINECASSIRKFTEVGDAGFAHKHLRRVLKVLAELEKGGVAREALEPLRADAAAAKAVILSHSKKVAEKLEELDGLALMGGIRASLLSRVGPAAERPQQGA
jgi:hypothetical protein